MQFDKGYISPYFATDPEAGEAVLENACVLLVREKISALADLLPLLEKVLEAKKPLLIVAEDVEGEALSTLVVNAIRKTFTVVAVKSPFFGDRRKAFIQDLAIVTGAEVVSAEVGLKLSEVGLEVLGSARRVTVTKDDTTIVDGGGSAEAVAERVRAAAAGHRDHRFGLGPGEAAGAAGQAGRRRRGDQGRRGHRDRGQGAQAPHRGRRARHQGRRRRGHHRRRRLGAGARRGRSWPSWRRELTGDEATGVAIVRRALSAPAFWIAANGGEEGAVVVNKIAELPVGQGYDAATGEYVDMVKAGIIDPVKVTKSAVSNAASIAGMVLTTESTVVDIPAARAGRTAAATTATATDPTAHRRRAIPNWRVARLSSFLNQSMAVRTRVAIAAERSTGRRSAQQRSLFGISR